MTLSKRNFEVAVYDEIDGGHDMLTIAAYTVDEVINIVEGNARHEYEIIEIEEIKTYGELA